MELKHCAIIVPHGTSKGRLSLGVSSKLHGQKRALKELDNNLVVVKRIGMTDRHDGHLRDTCGLVPENIGGVRERALGP